MGPRHRRRKKMMLKLNYKCNSKAVNDNVLLQLFPLVCLCWRSTAENSKVIVKQGKRSYGKKGKK